MTAPAVPAAAPATAERRAKAVTLIILMLVAITFYLWFVSRGRRGREVSIV